MSKADISTTPILSRRAVLAGIASAAALPFAATIPTTAAAAPAGNPSTTPHPDAKLFELGVEYERLLAIEEPLKAESDRLWNVADRLRYEKLGVDPDDGEARRAVSELSYSKWMETRDAADEEVGYNKAWKKTNRASRKTEGIGKKILKIEPTTMAGLLVRIRVIETHDELLKCEPDEQLLADIRCFAKRGAA
jgi:hypothetical protein